MFNLGLGTISKTLAPEIALRNFFGLFCGFEIARKSLFFRFLGLH